MKLLSLLLLSVACFADQFPGIKTSIGVSTFNSALQKELPNIISDVTSMEIPSEFFHFKFLLLPIKLKLSNFVISELSVDVSESNIQINNQTSQILLTLSNFNLFLTAQYDYYIPIDIGGEVNITLKNSTVVLPFDIKVDHDGKVSLLALPLQGDLESLDIEMNAQGFISETFMILTHLWPLSKVTNHILVNIFDNISTMMNPKIETYLGSIQYTDKLGSFPIVGDYQFYSISLDPCYINANINGTFFLEFNSGQACPVTPPSYVPNMISTSTIRIQLNEYFFDTMMWALYASNSLNFYIQSEHIPTSFPYPFTTTGLNKLVPNFSTVYGANLPVDLQCSIYQIPNIDIETDVSVTAGMSCNFLVRITSSVKVNAFTLLAQINTNFLATVQEESDGIYLYGSLDATNTDVTNFALVNSNVGNFNTNAMSMAVNHQAYYICLVANKILSNQGIRLPLPNGIQINSLAFNIYPGAVEIGIMPKI